MKALWSDGNKKRISFFREYASHYKMTLPDDAEYVIATDDCGQFCGFAALMSIKGLVEILFLVVDHRRRRQGFGRFLLTEIEAAAKRSGTGMVRAVLPSREDIVGLFKKAGYELFDGEKEYAIPFKSLHYSSRYRKKIEGKNPHKARTFDDIPPVEKRCIKVFYNDNNISGGAAFDNDISTAVIEEGRVCALLLCERVTGGLIVEYVYFERNHPEYLIDCFKALARRLSEQNEETGDGTLSVATGSGMERELLKYLTEGFIQPDVIIRENIAVKLLNPVSISFPDRR